MTLARVVMVLIAFGLCGSVSKTYADTQCKVQDARYQMLHDKNWTAGFKAYQKQPGNMFDIALFIHSASSGSTYWFTASAGNSPRVYLDETDDVTKPGWKVTDDPAAGTINPGVFNRFIAADQNLEFLDGFPKKDDKAPTYLLLTDVDEMMWYGRREVMRLDFFKLINCKE